MTPRRAAGFFFTSFACDTLDLPLFEFVLGQERAVDRGTIRHDGTRLHFGIDRALVPAGELLALEGKILNALARAAATHTAPGYARPKPPRAADLPPDRPSGRRARRDD